MTVKFKNPHIWVLRGLNYQRLVLCESDGEVQFSLQSDKTTFSSSFYFILRVNSYTSLKILLIILRKYYNLDNSPSLLFSVSPFTNECNIWN